MENPKLDIVDIDDTTRVVYLGHKTNTKYITSLMSHQVWQVSRKDEIPYNGCR
jgi:hypothetical protein